eukprot:CAMPEP_0204232088 /NCGR_PEP_ID=MMETSP0361-20130328/89167_1 /ASSEMBLY_ACC=CAM_ASM_000343 /TAXON_ID=268821 /ORGANISM="Scrippsiella Hangoei, Strain SHTV-5" /LENGTH=31 /DNA_ID= /DNA_START= /DNA_END= /DNA_ORIENTATION=
MTQLAASIRCGGTWHCPHAKRKQLERRLVPE